MDLFSFVVTVIILTASGALAPGPLFFATITHGTKHGAKSGLIFSIAHTEEKFKRRRRERLICILWKVK